ncbi:integrase [Haloferax sp. Atlit-6N]|uniref:tyrosine-type recombinase/integrase n=1 Tax=Haloferax sp. Atlit-6N TaxID=2077205 RepID=UPI000E2351EC|nr:site-specific integrase [Haloferax sp. Atlit-6N]REA04986.1 integrase [Haloferax sp. Atlit-6N]
MTTIEGITLVPSPSVARLNERQIVDYRHHRTQLIKWMLYVGKNPERAEGYAWTTANRRATNLDTFYRWVWTHEHSYSTAITHEHTNDYVNELAYSDHSATHKNNLTKTLKMYWRWRAAQFGDDPWEPTVSFAQDGGPQQPRDYLTREERSKIREAALEYGSVPHYNALSPEERREWKRYLAHRFRKPITDIGKQDFDRANSFKITSLVWTSLDAGLRPIEVARARVSWVDVDNAVLRIPASESSKNEENWVVSLQDRTAEALGRWIEERRLYEKYADTDVLWLTRESNPYQSHSLKYLLQKLCEIAQIPTENRKMSWYVIRHSTGTYLSREDGLASAQAQLRHRSVQTTMKYDNTPVEDRRKALERMG